MAGLLEGKKGIIFGALDDQSIAWKVTLKAKAEGADFLLTNVPVALRMGKIQDLAEQCDTGSTCRCYEPRRLKWTF